MTSLILLRKHIKQTQASSLGENLTKSRAVSVSLQWQTNLPA